MKTKLDDFEVLIPNPDGTAVEKIVTVQIPLQWDEELEMWILTPEAHRLIDDTKAEHMGLLLPGQMKELRQRLNFTQKQMGEIFQVGEKSWTRWESGKHRPTRSMSLLIRALYDGEVSLNYLLRRAGKEPQREAASTVDLWLQKLSVVSQYLAIGGNPRTPVLGNASLIQFEPQHCEIDDWVSGGGYPFWGRLSVHRIKPTFANSRTNRRQLSEV